ncbi:YolD-like family protein [Bacillaceae bacterium IKA-2]|nr:YolD-like family protein [Bacillaceae bacterium IKA-2]
MLPEHVAMLRKLKESTNYKTKPILDEQILEELNEMMCMSMQAKELIKLTYYQEHDYKSIIGVIQSFDIVSKCVLITSEEGISFQLKVENIIDVKMGD